MMALKPCLPAGRPTISRHEAGHIAHAFALDYVTAVFLHCDARGQFRVETSPPIGSHPLTDILDGLVVGCVCEAMDANLPAGKAGPDTWSEALAESRHGTGDAEALDLLVASGAVSRRDIDAAVLRVREMLPGLMADMPMGHLHAIMRGMVTGDVATWSR